MACRGRLAELILHITNLVYFCSGVAILVVGALALGSPSTVINTFSYVPEISLLENVLYLPGVSIGPGIYMTCLGSLVIILSFLGCGGVFKKNKGIIGGYGITTLLIMLFNIAVIMFYAIDPYFIETNVEYQMNVTLKENFEPGNISSSGVLTLPTQVNAYNWNEMQYQQGCCGVDGYADYESFNWTNNFANGISGARVPPSCCIGYTQNTQLNDTSQFINLTDCLLHPPSYTYTQGCSSYVMTQITRYNVVYCVVAAAITGLQAIILGMTMWSLVVHFEMKFV